MADRAEGSHDKILAAVEGAANDLQDVKRELEQLQQRATQLEEFIRLGKMILGGQADKYSSPKCQ
jgi:hypothetical protein